MTRILAVDDSTSMREMVTFTLESAGFEVVQACNGRDALAKARATRSDLVLTDINMPEMDGIALVKALRELPAYRFTPVLLLTTEAGSERKAAARAAGATGWLTKPFDPQALIATIQRVLGPAAGVAPHASRSGG